MKNLALIAMSSNTSKACGEQLRHLIGERVNITQYSLRSEPLPVNFHADLIVFLSQEASAFASDLQLQPGCPSIIARRSINYHEAQLLLKIPAGTDVLLVNDVAASTTTTIALLQTIGIDHINYYPYCPQMDSYPPLKIAVTPGEGELVPSCVETVIDIHTRLIDITTIVEILIRFELLPYYADFLSANYVRDIIRLTKSSYEDLNEIQRLETLVRRKRLQEQNIAPNTLENILGQSAAIQHTISIARKMAAADSVILIQGESGTGKELIAQGIHNASARRDGPFVAVNFAALSENLLESELFGYVPGAFTGASRQGAIGLFEEAHHGTIFLDEIGDAPLPFQLKLLRVLQEKQIRRIGSTKVIPIDVRVIVATNRDLKQLIAQGQFRRDLYYRLNVLPIRMPALRERGEDIVLLARAFYQQQKHLTLSAEQYFAHIAGQLLHYTWPGNIRELQNIVEYLTTLSPQEPPTPELLSAELQLPLPQTAAVPPAPAAFAAAVCAAIREANEQGRPIGRRSLAKKLHQPENRIRLVLEKLEQEGHIRSRRGRGGLQALL